MDLSEEVKLEPQVSSTGIPKFNEKILLFILAAFQFTHVLDFVIMMPLGPQFIEVFDITTSQFGLLVAAYTWSAGLFSLIGSFFIDKFDRRNALLILFAGFALGTFFCSISNSYIILLISRVFAGAFGGILGALVYTTIGDAIPVERRGKATGIVMSSFSVASVIGIPLGIYLASSFEWHMPFFFLTGISVLVWIYAFRQLPSMKSHMSKGSNFKYGEFLQNVFKDNNQKLSLILAVVLQIAGFLIIPYFAQYMVFNVGLSNEDLTYIYLFGGLFSFFTSRFAGVLVDKYGNNKVFIWGALLSIVPTIICTHMPVLPLWTVLILTTLFFIFNGARFVPAMAIMTGSVEPRNRGGFMSIISSLQQVASGVASFIGGVIVSQNSQTKELYHFNEVGYYSILASCICVLLVVLLKKPDRF